VHAKKAIDVWLELDNQQAINRMLAKLQVMNEKIYAYVREYLEK